MAFGGFEIILIFVLVLILFGAKKLPDLAKGLGRGMFEAGRAIDGESIEAGRSLGGIYGKPAAQALTPDNLVAELYRPAALNSESLRRPIRSFFKQMLDVLICQIWRILHSFSFFSPRSARRATKMVR